MYYTSSYILFMANCLNLKLFAVSLWNARRSMSFWDKFKLLVCCTYMESIESIHFQTYKPREEDLSVKF